MSAPEAPARRSGDLRTRYTVEDLDALTPEEARRFAGSGADPQRSPELAWELLYRREPELYDRLAGVERLHPAVLEWLPDRLDRIVEVGAGTGRLTLELLHRAAEIVAIEPAAPLREILRRRLQAAEHGARARVADAFFDDLRLPGDWADLVISCSAFTPEPGHGGEQGLEEMERVCRPGGLVALVWPNNLGWLAARGYRYESFAGEMFVEFASPEEAAELSDVFYPGAAAGIGRDGRLRISYQELGINPPRDVAFKAIAA